MTDIYVQGMSRQNIEEIALAWREALSVESSWAPELSAILERKLPTLWPDFSLIVRPDTEMVGVEGYTTFSPPMIVLPDTGYQDLVRQRHRARWTAAHELGHLFLHEATTKHRDTDPVVNKTIDRAYNSAEWQANRFASEFLMPEHVVSQFESAEELSRNCGVSLQAATRRFGEIRPEPGRPLPSTVTEYLGRHR
jgi:hypothetical protein